LNKLTRRSWILSGWIVGVGLAFGVQLLWLSGDQPQAPEMLHIHRGRTCVSDLAVSAQTTNVVLDDLRQKYARARRVEFHVDCSRDTSIFVLATGVQVHGSSGWQTVYEESRGDIWRLKSGIVREVCVERPESNSWRAFIRYGTEMRGWSLLRAQLKEAWILHSFSNWNGKPWGGGRWSGAFELFSDEVTE